ncbi:sarcosine oxidase subunit gamma [Alsobacter sp. R-9]
MPEILRRPPLAAAPPFAAGLVRIAVEPPAGRFVLRADTATAQAVGPAFGVALPERINTSAVAGPRVAMKLGPDEWLLIATDAAEPAAAAALAHRIEADCGGRPCSLVDVSHRQMALRVEGHEAALALNAAVPLDLSPEAFPVGTATRTIFEKAEIVLWRAAPHDFRVEVWRSFAPYVLALLQTVAEENAVA